MSQLKGFEFNTVTGGAVSGATADVWDAVPGIPGGSPLATTTTDSNGIWLFTGLSASPKDVRVTFSGRVRWYKGLTEAHLAQLNVTTLQGAPAISDFTNAPHAHSNAASGGAVAHASLSGVSSDQHHAQSHTHNGDGSGTVSHTSLTNIGSNSHATIDTHLAAPNPHSNHVIGTGSVGHGSGNVPLSDGTVNTNLNADLIGGYHVAVVLTSTNYTLPGAGTGSWIVHIRCGSGAHTIFNASGAGSFFVGTSNFAVSGYSLGDGKGMTVVGADGGWFAVDFPGN